MDNEQRKISSQDSHRRARTGPTGPPAPGSARQIVRNKGLVWVSAITLGAGAASALGAAAIAMSLPTTTTATGATSSASAATSTTTGSAQQASLTSGAAPTTATVPPVATSGAS